VPLQQTTFTWLIIAKNPNIFGLTLPAQCSCMVNAYHLEINTITLSQQHMPRLSTLAFTTIIRRAYIALLTGRPLGNMSKEMEALHRYQGT
jgi:hypothetical protein